MPLCSGSARQPVRRGSAGSCLLPPTVVVGLPMARYGRRTFLPTLLQPTGALSAHTIGVIADDMGTG